MPPPPEAGSAAGPIVAALMIGRGGSALRDKNVLPVHGVPLLLWAAGAARRSRYVTRFYVSSDDDRILATAGRAGYTAIRRPDVLAGPSAQSCDAVRHALDRIEADGPIDMLVVQHANVGTISEAIIDDCIAMLLADPQASAVVPAHDKAEYHPLRAKGINASGYLRPFVPGGGAASANRQDLAPCLFFDHSIWVLRHSAVRDPAGQGPWPCMGRAIRPFVTEGCLDVHSMEDIAHTERWITAHAIPTPEFDAR